MSIKSFLSSFNCNVDNFLFKRVDGIGLSIFRIAFSTVLFFEICNFLRFSDIIYKNHGEIFISFLLCTWLLSVFLILIGCFTRQATILNYIFSVVIFSGAVKFEYHIFYSYVGVSFVMMFLPLSVRLSVDSFVRSYRLKYDDSSTQNFDVPAVSYILPVFVGIGLVYFDSVFFKCATKMWTKGIGMWMPASLPQAVWNDTSWLLNQKYVVILLNYFIIIYEALFLVFMWMKKFRVTIFVVGFFFHLGIYIQYPIPYFATAYMAIYLLFIPVSFWIYFFGFIINFFNSTCLFFRFNSVFMPIKYLSSGVKLCNRGTYVFSTVKNYDKAFKYFLKTFIIILIFLQIITSWFSPFFMNVRNKYPVYLINGFSHKFMEPLFINVKEFSTRFLGVTHHGVFVDWHFRGFNHIVKIKYVDCQRIIHHVPILTDEGMVDEMVSGVTWRNIAFNVITAHVRKEVLEEGIDPYLKLFCKENFFDINSGGYFIFYIKYIDVPDEWKKNHLKVQLSKPWILAGTCKYHESKPNFKWTREMVRIVEEEQKNPF